MTPNPENQRYWDGSSPPEEVQQVKDVTAATMENTSFHSMEEWLEEDNALAPENAGSMGKKLSSRFKGKRRADFAFKSGLLNSWNLDESVRDKLEEGFALFGFSCKAGTNLTTEEIRLFSLAINKTAFNDEELENKALKIDMKNLGTMRNAIYFLTRALYILPCVDIDKITLETFVTPEYHKACQISSTKVWDDCKARGDYDTFRITKPVIPWVFKMTVQFRCSEIAEEDLNDLRPLLNGLQVHKALLLERTKRDKGSVDMTKKCKSLLIFHRLPDDRGVLCSNPTFIINTSIPKFLASIMDKVGSIGAAEVAESATKSRLFWIDHQLQEKKRSEKQDRVLKNVKTFRIRVPGCTDETQYGSRRVVPA
eukprot:TRINITY_DN37799_c0_g1_i1.p1 TRINITY_DN37799_c0_g1~~TRINITY_DN37799_c0_g1_i1.p1  ORF type:complete len:368 (+),score=37.08 TRINITY_DN37799_c0_g1_i1:55-1158(+)